MIPMDATLIEQVLINLMENAYVHSSSSDPIDLLITDQPDCVTFAVRDYGIGLDPDQIPFIFDGQYSSDTADGHKGIGIGLSICRTIIHSPPARIPHPRHALRLPLRLSAAYEYVVLQ